MDHCRTGARRLQSQQKILVSQAEHDGAPVAAVMLVLIGDVLARSHKVGEDSVERQFVQQPGDAGPSGRAKS